MTKSVCGRCASQWESVPPERKEGWSWKIQRIQEKRSVRPGFSEHSHRRHETGLRSQVNAWRSDPQLGVSLGAFGKLSPRGQDSLTMNGICLACWKPRVNSGHWFSLWPNVANLHLVPHITPTKPSLLVSLPFPSFLFPFSSSLPFSFLLASFISFFLFLVLGYQVFMSAGKSSTPEWLALSPSLPLWTAALFSLGSTTEACLP